MRMKWAALVVGFAVAIMLAPGADAKTKKTASDVPPAAPSMFSPVPSKAARFQNRCTHESDCRFCCTNSVTQNRNCTFDVQFCGQ